MKILLPVDGSECTKRMLAYIAAHDEFFGNRHEYVMLYAMHELPANVASLLDPLAIGEYLGAEVEQVFAPLRSFASQNDWRVKFDTAPGNPATAVARYSEQERFDLIVMGSHGRTALANVVMGSVATGVLAQCKTPVLLIR